MGSLPLIQTGATGIVAIIVWMILLGRLIPKSQVDQRMREVLLQLEQAKQDRDMWKAAYFTESRANGQLSGQVTALMEVGRTADHVIRSLPTLEETGEGCNDEVSTPT